MEPDKGTIALNHIERVIYTIRGQRVLLSDDLAEFYCVTVSALNQAAKRNMERFPADFMFQLTAKEFTNLRSQNVISRWGGRRYPPLAFTEQGVAMLSGLLRSPRAVAVNIEIMRAFVRLRHYLATHQDLARRLDDLEKRHEGKFQVVFEAIRQLMTPPVTKRRPIGFRTTARE